MATGNGLIFSWAMPHFQLLLFHWLNPLTLPANPAQQLAVPVVPHAEAPAAAAEDVVVVEGKTGEGLLLKKPQVQFNFSGCQEVFRLKTN